MAVTTNEPHKSLEDLIRQRAHALWLERLARGQPGTAESDWRIAELELAAVKHDSPRSESKAGNDH
jgi:hypothetical protein